GAYACGQEHLAHGEHEQYNRERGPQPKPARHAAEFWIVSRNCGSNFVPTLKRHSTNGTWTRTVRDHVRMHWAEVLDSRDTYRRLQRHTTFRAGARMVRA